MIECNGNCREHTGELLWVKVYDPKYGTDWGEFLYCKNAIKTDKKDGFSVILVEGKTEKGE